MTSKKRLKKTYSIPLTTILSLLMLSGITFHYFGERPRFNLAKIRSNFPYQESWEIHSPPEQTQLNSIFSQTFTYLGNGAQCFAFVSADDKYVLKFFKMNHLTSKKLLHSLPFPWLNSFHLKNTIRDQRLQETFSAFKMAYEHFSEESGLIFVHLNRTNQIEKKLSLIDKQGKEWIVDLDTTAFILQKKATLIYSYIVPLIKEENYPEAQAAIDSVLALIKTRSQKGFIDSDEGISHNYGFVQGRPIQIDVGRIIKADTSKDSFEQVDKAERKIKAWLADHYPQLFAEFEGMKKRT